MKKVLGLDLGVGSIGWSLINKDGNDNPIEIIALGSRIVPLSADDTNQFTKGQAITKNQDRTQKRTIRKGYDRYQQRREHLTFEFRNHGMLPDERLIKLPVMELWQLRADAATPGCKLTLPEIGRVLYHINQRRGYKHAKADENSDKKQRDYVTDINKRFAMIREMKQTIGQYFAEQLKKSEVITEKGVFYTYRIKEQVFPRNAYEAEFDQIMAEQRQYYPDVLTETFINRLKTEIIFYQRGLKSCKHLVSLCEFEKREYKNSKGEIVLDGPKVAPRTSPLFQLCKIWETVNNIKITNRRNEKFPITLEQRKKMVEILDEKDKLTQKEVLKILGLSDKDGWTGGKNLRNGIQGNLTKVQLAKALNGVTNVKHLLEFNLQLDEIANKDTGELHPIINHKLFEQPLYKLWHTIYSISDKAELAAALRKNFEIYDENIVSELYKLDFVKPGYSNKSTKCMRRILPFLQQGMMYSQACESAGFRHSESLTKAENATRILIKRLPQIKKNELRQPIVEKILNQMVNVVNAIIDKYGDIDEVRIELARELKQSKDEREATDKRMREQERENEKIKILITEHDVKVSRRTIQKYRLWEESDKKCFYCGENVSCAEFLKGIDYEIEHIIPRALLFDDSYSNKVCACRKCNAAKGKMTAYDYVQTLGSDKFENFLMRVDDAFKSQKISKTKRNRLLTPGDKIPEDFIERDLRLTQYISRKAVEILKQVCQSVYTSTGSVTDFVRRIWGYDNVLHNLNLERYRNVRLTEMVEFNHRGQIHTEERIKDWTKRMDHRHHAIDALVIAMTTQSIIQRLNKDQMFQEIEKQRDEWRNDYSLLEQWLRERSHFSVKEVSDAVEKIAVSFKPGKKVATYSKRIKYNGKKKEVLQRDIIVPRGALSQESVYGKIRILEKTKPIKYAFENPDLIFKGYIKRLVEERLDQYDMDVKKAIASLKKNPIMIGKNKDIELTYATCYKDEYVIKYQLSSLEKMGDIDSIVDTNIRNRVKERIAQYGGKVKEAMKDLETNPIYTDDNKHIPVKTVRCYTGLRTSVVTPVKYDSHGNAIGYVKPGNNHHIAIYRDSEGLLHEHIVTFWTAVERKKNGVPIVIKSPVDVWDSLLERNDLSDEFLSSLPDIKWSFVESMQQNEMFIIGMSDEEYNDAINNNDKTLLCRKLYRVQKISTKNYYFRLHIETTVDDKYNGNKDEMLSKDMRKLIVVQSMDSFIKNNPHKIRIDILGNIICI